MSSTKLKLDKKLERIAKKSFGDSQYLSSMIEAFEKFRLDPSSNLHPGNLPTTESFQKFIDLIVESNSQYEMRINISTRNISISSQELTEVNSKLSNLNSSLRALLENLSQGYMVFDQNGLASNLFTKVCLSIFNEDPYGKPISDLLHLGPSETDEIKAWINLVFQGQIPFESLKELGPKNYKNSENREFVIDYEVIKDASDGKITGLIMILTDITSELELMRESDERQSKSERLLRILHEKTDFFKLVSFVKGFSESCQKLKDLKSLMQVRNDLHTLKGAAAGFMLQEVVDSIQKTEEWIGSVLNEKSALNEDILDQLKLKTGESLIGAIQSYVDEYNETFVNSKQDDHLVGVDPSEIEALFDDVSKIDPKKEIIQRHYVPILGTKIHSVLSKFRRTIDQASFSANRPVRFELIGDNFKILEAEYEDFLFSLVHVFRNSVAHGIEDLSEREASGKPPEGLITVETQLNKAGQMLIIIKDDGAGVNIEKVKQKLLQILPPATVEKMGPQDLVNAIMLGDVSTKSEADQLSGMGIGLGAVKESVSKLQGEISISTEHGKFTEISITLPYFKNYTSQTPLGLTEAS